MQTSLSLVLLLTSLTAYAATPSAVSSYSSIKVSDCHNLSQSEDEHAEIRAQCPSHAGWQVFTLSNDERSWLELARNNQHWTTLTEVLNTTQAGQFAGLGSDKLEWRAPTVTAAANALIFRLSGQDPDHNDKRLSALVVLKLSATGPQFCGVAKSNQAAQELADKPDACQPLATVKD